MDLDLDNVVVTDEEYQKFLDRAKSLVISGRAMSMSEAKRMIFQLESKTQKQSKSEENIT